VTDQRTQHAQHSNPQFTTKRRRRLRPHVLCASCRGFTTGTGSKSASTWCRQRPMDSTFKANCRS